MSTTVKLNPEQDEIRSVARSFLAARFPVARVRELMDGETGFEESSWQEIADLGWTAIAIPEERGGAGYGIAERCLLLEEMGRVLYGGPYLSSAVLAADALALAASGEAAAELLASVLDGSTRATLVAAGDLQGSLDTPAGAVSAKADGESVELSGNGGMTLDATTAQSLVVVAQLADGSLGLFAVDPSAPGVTVRVSTMIDLTRKVGIVDFEGAPAQRLDEGGLAPETISRVLDRGAVALAAEMVGGARQAVEMTVEYLKEREQFGGPIGRFQALKHRLADIHVAIDGAREVVYSAADAIDGDGGDHVLLAAAAKSAASDAYCLATGEAIQLHGGIGFTEEHDIGLYYKRALSGQPMLGSAPDQRERIAAGLDV